MTDRLAELADRRSFRMVMLSANIAMMIILLGVVVAVDNQQGRTNGVVKGLAAQQLETCRSGNKIRHAIIGFIDRSIPGDGKNVPPAQQAAINAYLADARKTFAPRDCIASQRRAIG